MLPTLPQPYESLRLLGQGAFGCVVAARHPNWGEVAVKLLDAAWAEDHHQRQQFAREFALLQGLNHPSVPSALAWGEGADGRPFFAMTLMVGDALSPADGPWPEAALRPFLAGLASALDAIHALGMVHGDLKAENLLKGPDGRPLLLDFGGAAPIGQARERITGTLEYLAPEAFRLAPWAPESDWYAFGVLAHALITGALPFTGGPQALLRAHLAEAPPPWPEAWATAQPALAQALSGLLAKEPAARAEALPALRQALGLPAVAPGDRLRPEPWLPQAAAEGAWAEALAGRGAKAWRVEGPSSSGRSRLLARFGALATQSGRWVLGQGQSLGPKPLPQLLRWGAESSGLALPPQLAAWASGQLPEAWAQLEPRAQREAILRSALQAWGAMLAALGPVAVLWDAPEGGDELARAWRAQAIAQHPGEACLWASTDNEAPGEALPLAPWDAEAVAAYAAARLGQAPPEGLVAALLAHPWPGQVAESLAFFVQQGRLKAQGGAWRFQAEGPAWPGRRAQLQAALAACQGDEAQLLGLLACASGGEVALPWQALAQGLGWPWARLLAASAALTASGLVQAVGEGEARLAHPGLVADCLPLAPEPQAPLGRALAWWVARGQAASPWALSRLAEAAGDRPAARSWALTAFQGAVSQLDYPLAQRIWREAQAWAQGPEVAPGDAGLWLAWAGELHRALDEREAAEACFQAAIGQLQAGPLGLPLPTARFGLGKVQQLRGAYAEARAHFEAAEAEAIALAAWSLAARACAALARVHLFLGQGSDLGLAAAERGVAHGRHPGAGPGLAAALAMLGVLVGAEASGHAAASAHLEEALALCEASGDALGRGAALENLGNVHLGSGLLREAEATFARYRALCLATGNANEAVGADMNLSMVQADLGRVAEAQTLAQSLVPRAQAQGRAFPQAVALCTLGSCAFLSGDWPLARRRFDEALALLAPIANRYAEEHVRFERLVFLSHADRAAFEAELPEAWATNAATASVEGAAKLQLLSWEAACRWGQADAAPPPHWRAWADGPQLKLAWWAHWAAVGQAKAMGQAPEAASLKRLEAIAEAWASPWHAEAVWVAKRWAGAQPEGPPPQGLNPLALGRLAPADLPDGPAREAMLAWWARLPEAELLASSGWSPAWGGLAKAPAPALSDGGAALWAWAWDQAARLNAFEEEGPLLAALLEAVGQRFGADRGYLLAFQDGRLQATSAFGLDLEAEFERGHSRSIADEALFGGRYVYTLDARQDERWREAASVAALDLRMVFAAPIVAPEELLGVLYLERDRSDEALGHEAIQAVLGLIAQAAQRVAWLRAQAAFAQERWAAEARARLLMALWQAPTPVAQAQALLRMALALVPAERAFLFAPSQGLEAPLAWARRDGRSPEGPVAWSRSALAQGLAEGGGQVHVEGDWGEGWAPGQSVAALGLSTLWTWCCPRGSFVLLLDTQALPQSPPELALAALNQAFQGLILGPSGAFQPSPT